MREVTFTEPTQIHTPEERKAKFDEVKRLLTEDGWEVLDWDGSGENTSDCFVLALNVLGEVHHRYFTWDYEYDEWRGRSITYPCFWLTDQCDLSELDDAVDYFMICETVPRRTANTVKALEILEDL